MNIVVFTITCNRLDLTKKYIFELRKKAGYNFKHIIVDNGSIDGTQEYLKKFGFEVIELDKNYGIIHAFKVALKYILKQYNPDLVIKFDNDCEIHTPDILQKIVKFYESGCRSCIVAPLDDQILDKQRPHSFHKAIERGFNVNYTTHVGGIFKCIPRDAAKILITEENKNVGGDLLRGRFWKSKGFDSIYLNDLSISHRGIGKQTKNYKLA